MQINSGAIDASIDRVESPLPSDKKGCLKMMVLMTDQRNKNYLKTALQHQHELRNNIVV